MLARMVDVMHARNERNTIYGLKQTVSAIPKKTGERAEILQWRQDEQNRFAAPPAVGVQLGVVYPSGVQAQDILLRARVTWGDGSASFTALMDFVDGTSFALDASFVSLEVQNDSVEGTPDKNIVVAGLVAPRGNLSNKRRPQLTIPNIGAVGNPDFGTNLLVPAFAHEVTVVRLPTAGAFHLQYRDFFNANFGESASIIAGADCPVFKLPGNTRAIRVQQDGGTTSANVIWFLDL
jgi:hypothetical protein